MMSPSARIVAAAEATMIVTDGEGREITLRRLAALDRLRLFKALGGLLAQNPLYLGMATLAAAVTAIDGIPVPAPVNEPQLEHLISRLGDAGLEAVATALRPDAIRTETQSGN